MDNISAFPSNITNNPYNFGLGIHPGMTLRDYFAAHVLNGLMTQSVGGFLSTTITPTEALAKSKDLDKDCDEMAKLCYLIASSMIKERDKSNVK